MAKLTNISGGPRALPLSNHSFVEFAKGETKDFPDADYAAISGRTSVQHSFRVEAVTAPAAPAPAPAAPSAPEAVAQVLPENLPSADPKPVVKVKKAAAQ